MKKPGWKILIFTLAITPGLVFGQTVGSLIYNVIDSILVPLATLALTAALVVFFWGMIKYLMKVDDPKARADGKWMMVWAIVALFVMTSVWGLVGLVRNSFYLNNKAPKVIVLPS